MAQELRHVIGEDRQRLAGVAFLEVSPNRLLLRLGKGALEELLPDLLDGATVHQSFTSPRFRA
jgi:hypothetical protein